MDEYHNHYTRIHSAFSANLTTPNKQSFKLTSEFNSRDHVANS